MAEYDRFLSLARRILKGSRDKTEDEVTTGLHDAFVSCISELPDDLKHDIAYHFENVTTGASQYTEKLKEILYLFEQEYDRVEETFSRDDWEYLKDVVSDFALDIEQQRLTYIMQRITSRGVFDDR